MERKTGNLTGSDHFSIIIEGEGKTGNAQFVEIASRFFFFCGFCTIIVENLGEYPEEMGILFKIAKPVEAQRGNRRAAGMPRVGGT